MTKREFLRANRTEIDAAINRALNHVPATASCFCPLSGTEHSHDDAKPLNDKERWEWINGDEGLYNWARSEGVNV
jgi:hypothetical protein